MPFHQYIYKHHPYWRLDFDVDNVSEKVVKIIMSYTEYINRTVWFK